MNVRAGAKPNGKLIEVELEDSDMVATLGAKWNEVPLGKRFTLMSDAADKMLLTYMLKRGDISEDYYNGRLAEIAGAS